MININHTIKSNYKKILLVELLINKNGADIQRTRIGYIKECPFVLYTNWFMKYYIGEYQEYNIINMQLFNYRYSLSIKEVLEINYDNIFDIDDFENNYSSILDIVKTPGNNNVTSAYINMINSDREIPFIKNAIEFYPYINNNNLNDIQKRISSIINLSDIKYKDICELSILSWRYKYILDNTLENLFSDMIKL